MVGGCGCSDVNILGNKIKVFDRIELPEQVARPIALHKNLGLKRPKYEFIVEPTIEIAGIKAKNSHSVLYQGTKVCWLQITCSLKVTPSPSASVTGKVSYGRQMWYDTTLVQAPHPYGKLPDTANSGLVKWRDLLTHKICCGYYCDGTYKTFSWANYKNCLN